MIDMDGHCQVQLDNYFGSLWIQQIDLYKVINEYSYNTKKHANNPWKIGNTNKCT